MPSDEKSSQGTFQNLLSEKYTSSALQGTENQVLSRDTIKIFHEQYSLSFSVRGF